MDHEIDAFNALNLRNQLCFPLYASAKEVVRKYKPFLDKIDLTYTQYIAMMVMWEEKEMNVKELGEYLYLDSGTLTPLLKKLESKKLITRTRFKEDERQLCVRITDQGMALRNQAINIPTQIASCLPLSHEEVLQLYQLLYKILKN